MAGAPADLSAALKEIGREVMDGASTWAAMRELLRRGLPGIGGWTSWTSYTPFREGPARRNPQTPSA